MMDKKQGQSGSGPIDIEDLKEQGVRSDSVGSKTPGSKSKTQAASKYEFAEEINKDTDLQKTFTSLRDLDVDAMGKNKSGFDLNLWGKK